MVLELEVDPAKTTPAARPPRWAAALAGLLAGAVAVARRLARRRDHRRPLADRRGRHAGHRPRPGVADRPRQATVRHRRQGCAAHRDLVILAVVAGDRSASCRCAVGGSVCVGIDGVRRVRDDLRRWACPTSRRPRSCRRCSARSSASSCSSSCCPGPSGRGARPALSRGSARLGPPAVPRDLRRSWPAVVVIVGGASADALERQRVDSIRDDDPRLVAAGRRRRRSPRRPTDWCRAPRTSRRTSDFYRIDTALSFPRVEPDARGRSTSRGWSTTPLTLTLRRPDGDAPGRTGGHADVREQRRRRRPGRQRRAGRACCSRTCSTRPASTPPPSRCTRRASTGSPPASR